MSQLVFYVLPVVLPFGIHSSGSFWFLTSSRRRFRF